MALILSRDAAKGLTEMPRREGEQLRRRLSAIAADPARRHPGVKTLKSPEADALRLRQGDWRAVFTIEGDDVVMDRAVHRKDAHR